jgi:hypothetical protein
MASMNEHKVMFPKVIEYRGMEWELQAPDVTSDGCLISWGWLLDEEGNRTDEGHSFFLGGR